MKTLIQTPYGKKTPELLCCAMDALEREPELLSALEIINSQLTRCINFSDINSELQERLIAQQDIARAAIAKAKGEIK